MQHGQSAALIAARDQLVAHPLYAELTTPDRVVAFMEHHVFAVWDFFSLLKRLQREVTCVETPWMPRARGDHGRFIMEIVLAEETDEDGEGGHISHFELYRRAMTEVGADQTPIESFVGRIAAGEDPIAALQAADIPDSVRRFVGHTLELALHGEPHRVAASFCHGRENLLPDVLGALQSGIGDGIDDAPTFKHYLERHIELDHDEHGPLALRLLDSLCGDDPRKVEEAEQTGIEAIEARIALWDGVLEHVRARPVGV